MTTAKVSSASLPIVETAVSCDSDLPGGIAIDAHGCVKRPDRTAIDLPVPQAGRPTGSKAARDTEAQ